MEDLLCGKIYFVERFTLWKDLLCGKICFSDRFTFWKDLLCGRASMVLFFIPHTPERATYLTEEEKAAASFCMKFNAYGASNKSDSEFETFPWTWACMDVVKRIGYLCHKISLSLLHQSTAPAFFFQWVFICLVAEAVPERDMRTPKT